MTKNHKFCYDQLQSADLVLDAVYEQKQEGRQDFSKEPLKELLDVAPQKGFRKKKAKDSDEYSYILLFSTQDRADWPDNIDTETGIFTYYGDNNEPGNKLHETHGNDTLRDIFSSTHSGEDFEA